MDREKVPLNVFNLKFCVMLMDREIVPLSKFNLKFLKKSDLWSMIL